MHTEEYKELIDTIIKLQKLWLTPDELEAEFGILKSTQNKMRMKKTLPYSKVGKHVKYHRPEINQMFLDAKVV